MRTKTLVKEIAFSSISILLWRVMRMPEVALSNTLMGIFAFGAGVTLDFFLCRYRLTVHHPKESDWVADGPLFLLMTAVFTVALKALFFAVGVSETDTFQIGLGAFCALAFLTINIASVMISRILSDLDETHDYSER